MQPETSTAANAGRAPNLSNYEAARRAFSWAAAREVLEGLPDGGLNIAHEAVDRHAAGARRKQTALRWLGANGAVREFSYGSLSELSSRFANLLSSLGVGGGETVFALSGRTPELYVAALGSLKRGAVFCPLFAAFGPEPIRTRLQLGDARVLVTTAALYRRKVRALRPQLPRLRHVLIIDRDGEAEGLEETLDYAALMDAAPAHYAIPPTDPEQRALLHFTSGTTGAPKGAIHVHEAVLGHHVSGALALDLHPGDVFWCTADPGWVTGISYGLIAPLSIGATLLIDEAEFEAQRWYDILERHQVNVWYTSPTAIRMLMKLGTQALEGRDFSRLRFMASVGEPLNPEAVLWGRQAFGMPFHDNWWQTETGGIMIANFAAMPVRPGSMGRPLPGIEAAVVRRREDGGVAVIERPGEPGELALRPGWPSMFRGYLNEPERYQRCFADGWYLSGDLVRVDADGYFWFMGRADDLIKSAGHLIGPFEVESALLEHPAVAEAGVIGKPDPMVMEVVKAFVELKPGVEPSQALRRELLGFARRRLGAAVAPREIEFRAALPKTRSGKIMRRLLKARELGLEEGDLSALDEARPAE